MLIAKTGLKYRVEITVSKYSGIILTLLRHSGNLLRKEYGLFISLLVNGGSVLSIFGLKSKVLSSTLCKLTGTNAKLKDLGVR